MLRKIVSALLLLIILISLIPATSARADIPANFIPLVSAQANILNNPTSSALARIDSSANFISIASAQTNTIAIDPQCLAVRKGFTEGLGKFMVDNLLWGLGFMGADWITSAIASIAVIGGIAEPFNQAIDFLRNIWMQSLIWGTIASMFNWFAGSLIQAGMALNLTLSADNPLVSYGGAIILQLANFGLVVSIIIIGIATILRLKKDDLSADKLLFRLIMGIILVNLTIPIVTSIADLGTRVTAAMYRASSPCPENITQQFTAWRLREKFKVLLGLQARPDAQADPEGQGEEAALLTQQRQQILQLLKRFRAEGKVPGSLMMQNLPLTHDPGLNRWQIDIITQYFYPQFVNIQSPLTLKEIANFGNISDQRIEEVLDQVIEAQGTDGMDGPQFDEQPATMGGYLLDRLSKLFSPLILDLLSLVAAGAMSFIAAFTFLLFAAFLLIRFVILMLLLTFSPLIWLGFIFKNLKLDKLGNIWEAWWSQFLKWTFFGPIIVLFLAFISEYLHSITANPVVVPGGATLVQVGQLIAVIIIAAMGIFAASKFSGVAGGLVMSVATGGLGFVANASQGLLKKGQISAQMGLNKLKTEGEEDSLKAKALKLSSKGFERTATGVDLRKGPASALLGQLGVKPKIQVPTDDEIKKKIIKRRIGRFGNQAEKEKFILSLSLKDAQGLDEEDKKEFIKTIHQLRGKTDSLHPEQITALSKFEKAFAGDLAILTINDIKTNPNTGVIDDAEAIKIFSLTKTEAENIPLGYKKKVVAALHNAQKQYINNPSAFQSKQVATMRILEKAYAPDLVDLKMKDIQVNPNTGVIDDAEAIKIFSLTKTDIENMPEDAKEKAIAATYSVQRQHANNPSAFQSKQVATMRILEKAYALKLADLTMKEVKTPPSLVLGTPLLADDLNNIKAMLRMAPVSVSEIVNNGTVEMIEKSVQAILAMEKEVKIAPAGTFSREELGKLQNLRRAFNEKITNYIMDNLDPSINFDSILSFSNANLVKIGDSGSETEKTNIDKSIAKLTDLFVNYPHLLNPVQINEFLRLEAKHNLLIKEKKW